MGLGAGSAGGTGPSAAGMSAEQRQEVAASAAGAVEQAILRSLGVLDQQARAIAQHREAGAQPTPPAGTPFSQPKKTLGLPQSVRALFWWSAT